MLKAELASKVREKAYLKTRAEAEEAINAVIASLKEALEQGETMSFMGFGSFKVVDRAERKARNPQTSEEITIPAHKSPVFKPSKTFVAQLNKQ